MLSIREIYNLGEERKWANRFVYATFTILVLVVLLWR